MFQSLECLINFRDLTWFFFGLHARQCWYVSRRICAEPVSPVPPAPMFNASCSLPPSFCPSTHVQRKSSSASPRSSASCVQRESILSPLSPAFKDSPDLLYQSALKPIFTPAWKQRHIVPKTLVVKLVKFFNFIFLL